MAGLLLAMFDMFDAGLPVAVAKLSKRGVTGAHGSVV
jgi:hypothetical protein